jgi:hypothetical protein
MLTTNLDMKTACMKMVSGKLNDKLARNQICYELLEKIKDANFWNSVVIYNETWLFWYDPERSVNPCSGKTPLRSKKAGMSKK